MRKRQRAHPAEVAAGRSCNQSRCRDQRGRSEISINTECHSLVFKRPIWQERHLALVRSSWWRVGGLASVRESSELNGNMQNPSGETNHGLWLIYSGYPILLRAMKVLNGMLSQLNSLENLHKFETVNSLLIIGFFPLLCLFRFGSK